MSLPTLFVLGCWGAGKSTLGRALEPHGFRHVEIDRWREGDGVALWGVQRAWEHLMAGRRAHGFVHALRRASGTSAPQPLVVTFPGRVVFAAQQLMAIAQARIALIALHAPVDEILSGFLRRAQALGDDHGVDFWKSSNLDIHAALSQPHYEPYRVTSFAQGRFVGGDALAAIALGRMRSPVPYRLTA